MKGILVARARNRQKWRSNNTGASCAMFLFLAAPGCIDATTVFPIDNPHHPSYPPTCGDGVVQSGEECDDGNEHNTDACLETCVAATCGDGYLRTDVEGCDDGPLNADTIADACRADCSLPTCGDGVQDTGEACDDGDTLDGDKCTADCTDIDECIAGTDNCDTNATCTNTVGSFTCACNNGYAGDGVTCTDIDGCAGRPSGMIIAAIWRIWSGMPIAISGPDSPALTVSPFSFDWVRRVSTKPNATALTLILNWPHSLATVFVSPVKPAFAAE